MNLSEMRPFCSTFATANTRGSPLTLISLWYHRSFSMAPPVMCQGTRYRRPLLVRFPPFRGVYGRSFPNNPFKRLAQEKSAFPSGRGQFVRDSASGFFHGSSPTSVSARSVTASSWRFYACIPHIPRRFLITTTPSFCGGPLVPCF